MSLEEIQEQLEAYIDKHGIHGTGINRANNAVNVYWKYLDTAKQKEVEEEIKKIVSPFNVIFIDEDKPSLQV